MRQRTLKVERLGRIDYAAALDLQKQTERAVLTGEQPDTLLLLEHPHTVTLGRRSAQNERPQTERASAASRTFVANLAKVSSPISWPLTFMRSVMRMRCGEV